MPFCESDFTIACRRSVVDHLRLTMLLLRPSRDDGATTTTYVPKPNVVTPLERNVAG
jgi:hypothetical protein